MKVYSSAGLSALFPVWACDTICANTKKAVNEIKYLNLNLNLNLNLDLNNMDQSFSGLLKVAFNLKHHL